MVSKKNGMNKTAIFKQLQEKNVLNFKKNEFSRGSSDWPGLVNISEIVGRVFNDELLYFPVEKEEGDV